MLAFPFPVHMSHAHRYFMFLPMPLAETPTYVHLSRTSVPLIHLKSDFKYRSSACVKYFIALHFRYGDSHKNN